MTTRDFIGNTLLKKRVFFFLVLSISLFGSSCSLISEKFSYINNEKDLPSDNAEDYKVHLKQIGKDFLRTPGVKKVKLNRRSRLYLKKLSEKIVQNNELLLNKKSQFNFHIISDTSPFIFSLPGGDIFLSTSLITKYLKNEHLFVSVLTFELIKSQRGIYRKKQVVPVGFMRLARVLSLTKIPLKIKMEINKWAYLAVKRASYDPAAMLSWIQIQNKNTLDFSLQNGDGRILSKEEFLFKNFLAQSESDIPASFKFKNSSKGFYRLLRNVRRIL